MDKLILLKAILAALNDQHQQAKAAVAQAHEAATHEENVAENKYDTLGLEAAYLAHGLAVRESEYQSDIIAFESLAKTVQSERKIVSLGAFVEVIDEQERQRAYFMGPAAGGLKVTTPNGTPFTVITAAAPLGQALSGRQPGDEVEVIIAGEKTYFEIVTVQ